MSSEMSVYAAVAARAMLSARKVAACRNFPMPLHFSCDEYRSRLPRTLAAMAKSGLDVLLIFNQPNRYWLTGYDSFAFVLFECLVLSADGRMVLLTRPTDVPAARHTSVIEDIRVWHD